MNTRAFSKRQESQVADAIGGKRVKNSGGNMFAKGDVRIGNLVLVECKTPTKAVKSFAVKKEWLDGLKKEALAGNYEYCALCYQYKPDGSKQYVINQTMFDLLVETLKKEN